MTEEDLAKFNMNDLASLLNDDSFSSLSYTIYSNKSNQSDGLDGFCYGVDSLNENVNSLDFDNNSIVKMEISKDSKFYSCDSTELSQDDILKAKNEGYDFIAINDNGKTRYIILNEEKITNKENLTKESAVAENLEKTAIQQNMSTELSKMLEQGGTTNEEASKDDNKRKKNRELTEEEKKEREEQIDLINESLQKYGFVDSDTRVEDNKGLQTAVEDLNSINEEDFKVDPGYLESAIQRLSDIDTASICTSVSDVKDALSSINYSFNNAKCVDSALKHVETNFKNAGTGESGGIVASYINRLSNLRNTLKEMNPYYDVEVQRTVLENIEEFGEDLQLTDVEKVTMLGEADKIIRDNLKALEEAKNQELGKGILKEQELLLYEQNPSDTVLKYLTELSQYANALTTHYTDKTYGGIYERYTADEKITDEELGFMLTHHEDVTFNMLAHRQYIQEKDLGATEAKWYDTTKLTGTYRDIDMEYVGIKMANLSNTSEPLSSKNQAFWDSHLEGWNTYSKEYYEKIESQFNTLTNSSLATKRTTTVTNKDGNSTTVEYYECYVDKDGKIVSKAAYDADVSRMAQERQSILSSQNDDPDVNLSTLSDEELGITPSVRLVQAYSPYSLMNETKQYTVGSNMLYNANLYNRLYYGELSEYSSTEEGGKLYEANKIITETQAAFEYKGGVNVPSEVKTVTAEEFRKNPDEYNRMLNELITRNQTLLEDSYESTARNREADIKYYTDLVSFYTQYKEALNNRVKYEDYAKTIPDKYCDNVNFYNNASTEFHFESVMTKPTSEWKDEDFDFVLVERPTSKLQIELFNTQRELNDIAEELNESKPVLCYTNWDYIALSDGIRTPEDKKALEDSFLSNPVNAHNKELQDRKMELEKDSVRLSAEMEMLKMKRSDFADVIIGSNIKGITCESSLFGGYIFRFYSDLECKNQIVPSAEECAAEIALIYGGAYTSGKRIRIDKGDGSYLNITKTIKNMSESAQNLKCYDIDVEDIYKVLLYECNKEKNTAPSFAIAQANFANYYKEMVQLGNRQGGIELSEKWLAKGPNGVLGQSFWNGCVQWYEGMKNVFGGADGILSARDYANMYYTEGLGSLYGDIVRSASEITTSIGNMAPSIAINLVAQAITVACPPAGAALSFVLANASTISMGLSAGGNAMEQALQQGMSKKEAIIYGILTGASEALLEKVLGGIPGLSNDPNLEVQILQNLLKGHTLSTGAQAVLKFGTEMFSEGLEEFLQDVLDPAFKYVATNGRIQEEVDWGGALKSGVYGAITAGIMQGGGAVTSSIGRSAIQQISLMSTGTQTGLATLLINNSEGGFLTKENYDNFKSQLKALREAKANGTVDAVLTEMQNSPKMKAMYQLYENNYNKQVEDIKNMKSQEEMLRDLGAKMTYEEFCIKKASSTETNSSQTNDNLNKIKADPLTELEYKIYSEKYNSQVEYIENLNQNDLLSKMSDKLSFEEYVEQSAISEIIKPGSTSASSSSISVFEVLSIYSGKELSTIDIQTIREIFNSIGIDIDTNQESFNKLLKDIAGKKIDLSTTVEKFLKPVLSQANTVESLSNIVKGLDASTFNIIKADVKTRLNSMEASDIKEFFSSISKNNAVSLELLLDTSSEYMSKVTEFALEPTLDFYAKAAAFAGTDKASHFETYRTHCEAHVKDVAASSMEVVKSLMQTLNNENYSNDVNVYELYVASIWHDVGMAAGAEGILGIDSHFDKNTGIFAPLELIETADGDMTRSNHTLNSALSILLNADTIKEMGVDPAKIALLVFAHSKSNSGMKNLTQGSSYDLGINILQNCINKYNEVATQKNSNLNPGEQAYGLINYGGTGLIDAFVESGLIETYTDAPNQNGNTMHNIVYNGSELIKLATQSLALRLGDANTTNDNYNGTGSHNINQAGQVIETETTQRNTRSFNFTEAYAEWLTNPEVDKETKEKAQKKNKPLTYEDFLKYMITQSVDGVTIKLDGKELVNPGVLSYAYVLGEGNLTFRVSDNAGKYQLHEVCEVKDGNFQSAAVLYNVNERLGEIISGVPKNMEDFGLVSILLPSDTTVSHYQEYITGASALSQTTNGSVKIDVLIKGMEGIDTKAFNSYLSALDGSVSLDQAVNLFLKSSLAKAQNVTEISNLVKGLNASTFNIIKADVKTRLNSMEALDIKEFFSSISKNNAISLELLLDTSSEYMSKVTEFALEPTLDFYAKAAAFAGTDKAKAFETYRTHCEAHVKDVAASSMEVVKSLMQTLNNENYSNDVNVYELYVASIWHDVGMAAGAEGILGIDSHFDKETGIFAPSELIETKKGNMTRSNHTLNSALSILLNADTIKEMGVDPAKIALLVFAHSKSNSGMKNLTQGSSYDLGINILQNCINKYNEVATQKNSNLNPGEQAYGLINYGGTGLIDAFVESGLIETYTDAPNQNGNTMHNIVYNGSELIKLATQSLALRLGDANTTNDNYNGTGSHNINQAGQVIETETTQRNTRSFDFVKEHMLWETDPEIDKETKQEAQEKKKVLTYEDFLKYMVTQSVDGVTIKLDGKELVNPGVLSYAYVLGEGNLTFRVSDNAGKYQLHEVCEVKDGNFQSAAVLYNVNERLGEIISGVPKNMEDFGLVSILLPSDTTVSHYQEYITGAFALSQTTNGSVKIDVLIKGMEGIDTEAFNEFISKYRLDGMTLVEAVDFFQKSAANTGATPMNLQTFAQRNSSNTNNQSSIQQVNYSILSAEEVVSNLSTINESDYITHKDEIISRMEEMTTDDLKKIYAASSNYELINYIEPKIVTYQFTTPELGQYLHVWGAKIGLLSNAELMEIDNSFNKILKWKKEISRLEGYTLMYGNAVRSEIARYRGWVDSEYGKIQSIINKAQTSTQYKSYISYQEFLNDNASNRQKWESTLTAQDLKLLKEYRAENSLLAGSYSAINTLLRIPVEEIIDAENKTISLMRTNGVVDKISFDKIKSETGLTIEEFIEKIRESAINLDEIIRRSSLEKDTVLYRGISPQALLSDFGIDVLEDSESTILEKLQGHYSDKGFMSTSVTMNSEFFENSPIVLVLKCSEGTPAVDLSTINSSEQEVLLSYGQKFEAERVEKVNGKTYIYLTTIN